MRDILSEKDILRDLSRVINRAEEYSKKTREKDRDLWIRKHKSKFDQVFDIDASRDKKERFKSRKGKIVMVSKPVEVKVMDIRWLIKDKKAFFDLTPFLK